MRLIGRRYDTGATVAIDVVGSTIASITSTQAAGGQENIPWIAPGFVDLQVNGCAGRSLTEPAVSEADVAAVSTALDASGTTGYLPTVTTASAEVLLRAMEAIRRACESSPAVARHVAGIHLEGPYVSRQDGPRGAHPAAECRPPDWDEFQRLQQAAGGRIRILTLSPEFDRSAQFVARVVDSGVVAAIGHTAATSDQIKAAVDAGARLSTHLGNGSHSLLPRHRNYVWDQLAEDRLWASLIVDGHHLPDEIVKTFVRAKTPERCILISDVTAMAGMKPGRYADTSLGDVEVLPDGRVVVAGQRELLAGASLPISVGVAGVMRAAGVDLKTAVEMAATRPAELIGRTPGRLEVGAAADLVQFDLPGADGRAPLGQLTVLATINGGEVVFGEPWKPGEAID